MKVGEEFVAQNEFNDLHEFAQQRYYRDYYAYNEKPFMKLIGAFESFKKYQIKNISGKPWNEHTKLEKHCIRESFIFTLMKIWMEKIIMLYTSRNQHK